MMNRKLEFFMLVLLVGMFASQTYFLSGWERSFSRGMEIKRERVQRDAIAAGLPVSQVQAIASAMSETQYEVSSYVWNVGSMLIGFNFTAAIIVLMAKQKTTL